jgi:hypothetical protein
MIFPLKLSIDEVAIPLGKESEIITHCSAKQYNGVTSEEFKIDNHDMVPSKSKDEPVWNFMLIDNKKLKIKAGYTLELRYEYHTKRGTRDHEYFVARDPCLEMKITFTHDPYYIGEEEIKPQIKFDFITDCAFDVAPTLRLSTAYINSDIIFPFQGIAAY